MQCIITEKQSNPINMLWLNKEKGSWLTVVRAKANLKLSHCGPSQRQASGTNPLSWATVGLAKDKHQAPTHQVEPRCAQPKTRLSIRHQPTELSLRGPSQRHASGTNPPMIFLGQHFHWVWVLTHCCAIKEETITINHDWVYHQAGRLSHDIHVVSNFFFYNVWLFFLNWSLKEGFPTVLLNV